MTGTIDQYLRRPGRYENIDGLVDLNWGLMILGFALFDWFRATGSPESVWRGKPAQMFYIGALVLALHFGRKAVKRYVTYRRTGFIEHRKTLRNRLAPLLAGVISSVVALGTLLVLGRGNQTGMGLLLCLSNGAFYAVATRLERGWQWGLLAWMTAGTVAISLMPLDRSEFDRFVLVFLGLSWVASGVSTFASYLIRTGPPERAGE